MFGFEVNKALPVSAAKQLAQQIRGAILSGALPSGEKMPPTRSLAAELNIARNTVIEVYEQLLAEGYLLSKTGSGTYVAGLDALPAPRPLPPELGFSAGKKPQADMISFDPGNPDCSAFPQALWAKLLREACLDADLSAFGYLPSGAGVPALQSALRAYLYRMKGIVCSEAQVVILPGTFSGLQLLAKALYREGGTLAVEDPCMPFVRQAFEGCGYDIHPVEVDAQGMKTDELKQADRLRAVYTVPSHQFPVGGVLPIARRVSLLRHAAERDAYVIEDDYDGEFRYEGEPIQPLHRLNSERVIYLGSFSKIFSPALRIAYLILPWQLRDKVVRQMELTNTWANTIEQLALARLIDERLLDKHIYRMKKLYEAKRLLLMRSLSQAFDGRVAVSGENAGMHLLAHFTHPFTRNDYGAFARQGVEADCVERYAIHKGRHEHELVLGYGNLSDGQIQEGVQRLKYALKQGEAVSKT